MKKRLGFVSNSSSSSYVVNIRDIESEKFYDLLWSEYSWDFFNKAAIIESLEKQINENKKSKFPFVNDWNKDLENKIEDMQSVNSDDKIGIIKFVLGHNGITIREHGDEVELEYFTAMHNDFNTGMNDMLKEIILFFSFDTDFKVIGRRIDCQWKLEEDS